MKQWKRMVLWLALPCVMAGCATKATKSKFVFYPPPPDEPHIQYLASFSSARDLGGNWSFQDFVLGTKEGSRMIAKPYGIAAHGNRVYICDSGAASLAIVDFKKPSLRFFNQDGEGRMRQPINVAVDTNGTVYVTDTDRGQVLIYSDDENYVDAIGKKDEMKPSGIAVTADRIYVGDLKNHLVRVYDKAKLNLLFTIPGTNSPAEAKLFLPISLAVNRQGQLCVSDAGGFFVKIFDAQGNLVRKIGDAGQGFGQFFRNKGIATDAENRIYVVDAATSVAQFFDDQGQLLTFLGDEKAGGEGALYLPAGVAVDYENIAHFQKYAAPGFTIEYLIYVTNQVGTHRVSVFGFGHKEKR